jgi:hypothetical protein
LIQRFEREYQKLNKRFSQNLDSKIKSVSYKVSQVQKEVDVELGVAKRNIDTVMENLERKLIQQTSQPNIAIDELATKIVDTRPEIDVNVNQVDSKVEKLNHKFD